MLRFLMTPAVVFWCFLAVDAKVFAQGESLTDLQRRVAGRKGPIQPRAASTDGHHLPRMMKQMSTKAPAVPAPTPRNVRARALFEGNLENAMRADTSRKQELILQRKRAARRNAIARYHAKQYYWHRHQAALAAYWTQARRRMFR